MSDNTENCYVALLIKMSTILKHQREDPRDDMKKEVRDGPTQRSISIYIVQASLKLRDSPTSDFQVLEVRILATRTYQSFLSKLIG